MVYNPFVIVEVWDSSNTALICELPRRWGVTGSDPLNVAGVGTVSISVDDAVFTRHAGLLGFRQWVKFYIGDGTGGGRYVGAFQVRQRKLTWVGTNEWGDRVLTVSGPMVLGITNDYIVRHETQPPAPDASGNRAYAWTARAGEWYEDSSWSDALTSYGAWNTHITNARSGKTGKPSYQPKDWPDPLAQWVHVTGGGTWQFSRTTITIPVGGLLICWYLTADEVVRGFIDGDLVISRDEYETGYKSFAEKKMFLPEGDHTFAVMMRSKGTPGGDGIDPFLSTVMTLNGKGDPTTVLRRSQVANWKGHSGLPVPGWRQAEILRSQINEAQGRGNLSASLLTVDFTSTTASDQSAGEDRTWVAEFSKSMRIGTKGLDAIAQLCALGSFDVWVDFNATPAAYKLKAAKRRGRDRSATVTLEPGRNLIGWEVTETDAVQNDAVVQYDGGWVNYQDATSIGEWGNREIGISLGAVQDDDTATTIAASHVITRKQARKRAGASDEIHHDEDDQPVAGIVASPGSTPFLDYGTGDSIKVPASTGVLMKQRLLALSFAEDNETGQLSFDPEFGEELG